MKTGILATPICKPNLLLFNVYLIVCMRQVNVFWFLGNILYFLIIARNNRNAHRMQDYHSEPEMVLSPLQLQTFWARALLKVLGYHFKAQVIRKILKLGRNTFATLSCFGGFLLMELSEKKKKSNL